MAKVEDLGLKKVGDHWRKGNHSILYFNSGYFYFHQQWFNCSVFYPTVSEKSKELRIVLVGKTGAGRSASGNTILGRKAFVSHFALTAVTTECTKARAEVDGRDVCIIDTPGLFDTGYSNEEIIKGIAKCLSLSSPGPHVILLIIQLGRFTQEDHATVKIIKEIFGEESANYTMVLFTHGDRLEIIPIEKRINQCKELKEFTAQCKGGYHVFNNAHRENRSQVTELLQKIDKMVKQNGGGYYTTEMCRQAEAAINKKIPIEAKQYRTGEEEMERERRRLLEERRLLEDRSLQAWRQQREMRRLEERLLEELSYEKGRQLKERWRLEEEWLLEKDRMQLDKRKRIVEEEERRRLEEGWRRLVYLSLEPGSQLQQGKRQREERTRLEDLSLEQERRQLVEEERRLKGEFRSILT